jgi:hypothetical protein
MQMKIVFAVICTSMIGFGIFAPVSMSGAGALPTCGCPPGYERQTNGKTTQVAECYEQIFRALNPLL